MATPDKTEARIRIATRGSALALVQARAAAARIQTTLGAETELVVLRTAGDRTPGPLAAEGGKGLFVKELEQALLGGRADAAVHSAKDLPAQPQLAAGLRLAAFPERGDPRDALVLRANAKGGGMAALPRGARIGSGSGRRAAQLLAARPDLHIIPMRGNVDTRLHKLQRGEQNLHALVLACAGLDRLGRGDAIAERISPALLLPAPAQGTLVLQTRAGAPLARELAALCNADVRCAALAERAFQAALGGDCTTPLAALATPRGDTLRLEGLLAAPDGARVIRHSIEGARRDAEQLGRRLAAQILAAGGNTLQPPKQGETA